MLVAAVRVFLYWQGSQLPGNHSPLFAPVPKSTIETGVEAMTLAVLSVFDQHAGGK